ncbi:MAG: malto-oligosyltrehalose trehalohydrolase [Chloroflexi bacterium]|nr:malto-oligosyltrehalose trehalohydrolase [Chloroflexota bacterium]
MPGRPGRARVEQEEATSILDRTSFQLDMGATPTADGVQFRVWAPAPARVEVELADTGQLVAMDRDGDALWSAFVSSARPGTRYGYRLNGQLSRPDPYSRSQPQGPHGPSAVVDPNAYRWHDHAWLGQGIQGLVIYQLHIGTATPEGTFDSLIAQLPRIKALGVSAIEPLPVTEFPGQRNWGYDGVDLFAPAHVYGGPDALKRLVDAAHQHGLGVILDVVYNHFGPDGNYLRDFSPDYFTERYHTPWGAAINYDGPPATATWVRRVVLDNARYWLHEYHADGLRLDATHAIYDNSPQHLLAELTRTVRASLPPARQVALTAETHENDVRYLKPVEDGGFGFDAVWADDFHHTLRRYLAGDHEGYYADFSGSLAEVARCIEQGWLYEGQARPSTGREEKRGTRARDRPARQFIYTLQNHDQVGNRPFGDRLHHQVDTDTYRAAATLLLFLPYTPLLFMGQEFGACSPFQYFTDHRPDLGKLVTEGRRREFQAFSLFADPRTRDRIPDPQAESTFLTSKLRLADAETEQGAALQALYRQLLDLRRTDPVLAVPDRHAMAARALTREVLAVRRSAERLLLANFGAANARIDEFGGDWRVLLDSGVPTHVDAGGVSVGARSATILGRDST